MRTAIGRQELTHHPAQSGRPSRATTLALALVVTLAARAIPSWPFLWWVWSEPLGGDAAISYELFGDLVLLTLGLCLALSAPRRSGLVPGRVRTRWRRVLLVCGAPVVLTAVVYPNLEVRPFADAHWSMWVVSPLAQDLVFIGFLYGQLELAFPGALHPRIGLSRALAWTAAFFALWHVPNLAGVASGYVAFQLAYTAVGLAVVGLSRQWTGSISYAVITHVAVNAIAWSVG